MGLPVNDSWNNSWDSTKIVMDYLTEEDGPDLVDVACIVQDVFYKKKVKIFDHTTLFSHSKQSRFTPTSIQQGRFHVRKDTPAAKDARKLLAVFPKLKKCISGDVTYMDFWGCKSKIGIFTLENRILIPHMDKVDIPPEFPTLPKFNTPHMDKVDSCFITLRLYENVFLRNFIHHILDVLPIDQNIKRIVRVLLVRQDEPREAVVAFDDNIVWVAKYLVKNVNGPEQHLPNRHKSKISDRISLKSRGDVCLFSKESNIKEDHLSCDNGGFLDILYVLVEEPKELIQEKKKTPQMHLGDNEGLYCDSCC